MSDDILRAREALESIPSLANFAGEITRLGGLTNLVFKAGDVCLRIPGAGTEEYINREHEGIAAREAAKAEVTPAIVYFDVESGLMATRFIGAAVTMSPERFKDRTGSPARAAAAFRKLHSSGAVFPFRFELFSMIDGYLKILWTKDVALPDGYHRVMRDAEVVRRILAANAAPLTPCHCDPLCENFLDTGKRMWIVDWEYSGMNDPMWDLGDLSVEAGFDDQQDEEMIAAYFGGKASAAERGRIVIYKAMCDLLWTLWGLIQLANNNPADDFRAYADGRFARCRALMDTAEFRQHVAAVGG